MWLGRIITEQLYNSNYNYNNTRFWFVKKNQLFFFTSGKPCKMIHPWPSSRCYDTNSNWFKFVPGLFFWAKFCRRKKDEQMHENSRYHVKWIVDPIVSSEPIVRSPHPTLSDYTVFTVFKSHRSSSPLSHLTERS